MRINGREIDANSMYAEPPAAEILNRSVATLRYWRRNKIGPAWHKVGRDIQYLGKDIIQFIQAGRVSRSIAEFSQGDSK